MGEEGWYRDPLERWEFRRFDGQTWTFEIADGRGVTGNWFEDKELLALTPPPNVAPLVLPSAMDRSSLEVDCGMVNMAEDHFDGADVAEGPGAPEVYSGWIADPIVGTGTRYVSGGCLTPFVIRESGVMTFDGDALNSLTLRRSSAAPDDTRPWSYELLNLANDELSYEESVSRLWSIPPELYLHVIDGRSFSNAFWSENLLASDPLLVLRGVVLCLEWNRQYDQLWLESRPKFFASWSLRLGLNRLNRSPLNREIVHLFRNLKDRSYGRYLAWVADLAVSDPEHHARVVFYEQQNQIIAQQERQLALQRSQNNALREIQFAQERQLSATLDQTKKIQESVDRWTK